MPLNPRCIACGKKAAVFQYRPYCSDECNPEKKTKKTPAKPKTNESRGEQNV